MDQTTHGLPEKSLDLTKTINVWLIKGPTAYKQRQWIHWFDKWQTVHRTVSRQRPS